MRNNRLIKEACARLPVLSRLVERAPSWLPVGGLIRPELATTSAKESQPGEGSAEVPERTTRATAAATWSLTDGFVVSLRYNQNHDEIIMTPEEKPRRHQRLNSPLSFCFFLLRQLT